MTRMLARLWRDARAASAAEFALVVPVLFIAIIGAVQLGVLFFANAGLNNALDEGARYATIYDTTTATRPTNTQITTFIRSHQYGLRSGNVTGPTYATGTNNGAKYLDITMSYQVPLDFILFRTAPVTITRTRRTYVF